MKKRILSIFCAFLTAASFFGGISYSTETAEASGSHIQVWKECKSNEELEAYLGTKYAVGSTDSDRWKTVKIVAMNYDTGKWQYLSTTNMDPGMTDIIYNRETGYTYSFYSVVCGSCMKDLTEDELSTMEDGYIISTSATDDNVKLSASTLAGKNISETRRAVDGSGKTEYMGGESSDFTVQMKISDTFSVADKKHLEKSQEEFWGLDDTKACYGLLSNTEQGHTLYNMVIENTVACQYSHYSNGGWTNYVDHNVCLDWLFCAGKVVMTVNVITPNPVFCEYFSDSLNVYSDDLKNMYATYYDFWKGFQKSTAFTNTNSQGVSVTYYSAANQFMIYLPVGDSMTTLIAGASVCAPDGDWTENWDWEKYYSWQNTLGTSKYARMCNYWKASGNYTETTDSTVTYTGDVYIPSGTVWTIPKGTTVILSGECTVFLDGELHNNGTLIVEPGAMVTYLNRDLSDLNMIAGFTRDVEGYYTIGNSNSKIYSNRFMKYDSYGHFTGLGSYGSVATTSYWGLYYNSSTQKLALLKNGISNNGSFVIRKDARVDIPRFTQSSDGKTWLYGTMAAEEIFNLGTELTGVSTDTMYSGSDDPFEFTYSSSVEADVCSFTIDGGTLYILEWAASNGSDKHRNLWTQSGDNWSSLLSDNSAASVNGPIQAIFASNSTTTQGFNLLGSSESVTPSSSVKGCLYLRTMTGYK